MKIGCRAVENYSRIQLFTNKNCALQSVAEPGEAFSPVSQMFGFQIKADFDKSRKMVKYVLLYILLQSN